MVRHTHFLLGIEQRSIHTHIGIHRHIHAHRGKERISLVMGKSAMRKGGDRASRRAAECAMVWDEPRFKVEEKSVYCTVLDP